MTDSGDASRKGRVNISAVRQIFVVPLLTVENVMKLLVCSRSSAYEHMNRALGRTERPGVCCEYRSTCSRTTSPTR